MVKFSTPSEELQNMIRFHHSRPHDRYPCAIRVKSSHGAGETIPLASGYIVKFRDQTVYYHEAGGLCRRLNDKERRKLANQYHEIHWSLGTVENMESLKIVVFFFEFSVFSGSGKRSQ
ncbi:hypothetical protein B9Z55_026123 [Caenorhabditis nigoni]|uniref:Uncharacterized protein n=1 Tax=Caenorhabditis nigoni TaxID=1611254 RepID=A0A2G5T1X0_9PELO|nr:hypothetical protein B9Z55_026123 [Caenorhabditis nigoni]